MLHTKQSSPLPVKMKWGFILATLPLLASLAIWPFLGLMTAFMFDAPQAMHNPGLWLFALSILLYPVLILLSLYQFAKAFYHQNARQIGSALKLGYLPIFLIPVEFLLLSLLS